MPLLRHGAQLSGRRFLTTDLLERTVPTSSSCVVPVVDYEPLTELRPRFTSVSDRTSTSPAQTEPDHERARYAGRPLAADSANARAAAAFADAALRRVLEVIDRRRPLAQLRPLLAAGLLDSLLGSAALRGSAGLRDSPAAAQLRRVRVQLATPTGTAAEVAASYSRGERVHAIACRMEQVRTPTGTRWEIVALHLG